MFKKKHSVRLVGAVGAALLALGFSAGSASASPSAGYVGYGHTTSGTSVWCVQHLVNDYRSAAGEAPIAQDGSWGPQTEGAVVEFQKVMSLQPDGVVGPVTGGKLLNYDWTDVYAHYGSCYPFVPSNW